MRGESWVGKIVQHNDIVGPHEHAYGYGIYRSLDEWLVSNPFEPVNRDFQCGSLHFPIETPRKLLFVVDEKTLLSNIKTWPEGYLTTIDYLLCWHVETLVQVVRTKHWAPV